ncbi:MAG TPA: DHA2 family efflux MFS transporter permease subunit [Phenylobacterium sp.]|nr:DHA2 family efflux MFS transporter permease subunit [Phenylobacterium sp.]
MADVAASPGLVRRAPTDAPIAGVDIPWAFVFLGFGGMVIGQFMALLDIQIVAASLAQIQAGVGASADEIAWVQTIYLLAEVVVMPLTAYLTRMWGTRPFFMGVCAAFVVSSVLVGLTNDIWSMIAMRAVQGLAAGAMIPVVFATAMSVFPEDKRITANVIVGLIVTLAPTIGPTLGGHLTEALSWRWLFFMNIPFGLLAIFLVWRWGDFDRGDPTLGKGIDWWGVGLLTVGLLAMQYVFEEGAEESWFQDDTILWLTVIAVFALAAFLWRQLAYRQPIIRLTPFRDRNFALGSVMNFVTGMSLFGGSFILPLFLAQIRGYSAAEVGTTMAVSGGVMFVMAPVSGRVVRAFDPRVAMFVGFAVTAYGMGLGVRVTEDWGFWQFAVLQAIRGAGIMVAMIAANQLAISTMPVALMKDASALINLIRNVGGAVGLALLSTELTTQRAYHFNDLTAGVPLSSPSGQAMLAGLTERMRALGVADPDGAAMKAFGGMLQRQAGVLAYGDAFGLLAMGCVIAAILALFAAPPKNASPSGGGGH